MALVYAPSDPNTSGTLSHESSYTATRTHDSCDNNSLPCYTCARTPVDPMIRCQAYCHDPDPISHKPKRCNKPFHQRVIPQEVRIRITHDHNHPKEEQDDSEQIRLCSFHIMLNNRLQPTTMDTDQIPKACDADSMEPCGACPIDTVYNDTCKWICASTKKPCKRFGKYNNSACLQHLCLSVVPIFDVLIGLLPPRLQSLRQLLLQSLGQLHYEFAYHTKSVTV